MLGDVEEVGKVEEAVSIFLMGAVSTVALSEVRSVSKGARVLEDSGDVLKSGGGLKRL